MKISRMRNDIAKLVDFEKLKKCNDICYKWAIRMKVKKPNYARFMWNVIKNPEAFQDRLAAKYRSQFLEDCKTMFYAAEVEEILINQYSAMVINIMKRMRIQYLQYEDHLTDGYMAIRSAVWQYRTYKVKASFTTYAHRAIFMRIRGKLHKERMKKLNNNVRVACMSDFESEEISLTIMSASKDCAANMEDINQQIVELSKNCSLTEQETMILLSFANRKIDVPTWYEDYRKKYLNTKSNKQLSRQSIYNHLAVVHEKVLFYMQQKGMTPIGYLPPKTRRGDFR